MTGTGTGNSEALSVSSMYGSCYEPFLFAALDSIIINVAVCTKSTLLPADRFESSMVINLRRTVFS